MNNTPLVSIIVPVYGTEQYLPKCVDSIRQQSFTDIEIILVDDRSPDKCPQICDSYREKDDRIEVIHQMNTGVSGARNTGIRRAMGEYLMFVDSDDELYPDAVKILLDDMREYSADIVSCSKTVVLRDGQHHDLNCDGDRQVYTGEEPLVLSLDGNRNMNAIHAKLFRKAFIEGLYFSQGNDINEDGFFLFECFARQPKLIQHNIPVYRYQFRQESHSRYGFSDKYLSMLYFCEQKKKIIREQYPQYEDKVRNVEVRTNLQMLDLLCRTNDKKYKDLEKSCVGAVRRNYRYHRPINAHHAQLARIVRLGLYPVYKFAVGIKYH